MRRVVKISEIRIKGLFKNSVPNDYKLAQCREYWNQHGFYLHDIIVNDKGYLVDGYIQYLVLKESGVEDAVVKDFDKKVYKINKPKVRKSNKKKILQRYRNSLCIWYSHRRRNKRTGLESTK